MHTLLQTNGLGKTLTDSDPIQYFPLYLKADKYLSIKDANLQTDTQAVRSSQASPFIRLLTCSFGP